MEESVYKFLAGLYQTLYEYLNISDIIKDASGGGDGTMSRAINGAIDMSIDTIVPAASSIGLAIALLFFIMAMIDLASSERLTLEFFIKFFSKLAISVVLITCAGDLVHACIDLGNAITADLAGAATANTTDSQTIYDTMLAEYQNSDIFWLIQVIKAIPDIFVMFIAGMVVRVVVYIIGFTRIMELCVRGCVLPIALGLLADDGWRGAGGRYIRKFLAICSQGAVLSVIATISSNLMVSAVKEGVNSSAFLILLGVAFATVSLMFKSIGIVNDVFGA